MESSPVREDSFPPEATYYIDKLERKERECGELLAQFNKYKLKTKVRFDQLRHEVHTYLQDRNEDVDEHNNPALLRISLVETQSHLEESQKFADALQRDFDKQQLLINDQIILIRNLEEQLRMWEESEESRERRLKDPVDMEKVQQQMMYKDERIVELNNVILDKERQILDLQDIVRSTSEVATSKNEAMRIVQRKFDELEGKTRKEISTETEEELTGVSFSQGLLPSSLNERHSSSTRMGTPGRPTRTSSPGRAVHIKGGNSSPPPLDPAEQFGFAHDVLDDQPTTSGTSSKLTKTREGDSLRLKKEKQRKRVTFDLPTAASREDISKLTANADSEEIADALVALNVENERLRRENDELRGGNEQMSIRLAQAESLTAEAEREARTASLKARAVAQARIKDLEDKMATLNTQSAQQTDRLQTEVETLRSTRDWEVEQNAKMREQLSHDKEKVRQLAEELTSCQGVNRASEEKIQQKETLIDNLVGELQEAEGLVVFLEDQKHAILDDVDKLTDAMVAHEEYIELLEADIIIYETRVGNLREELGVSKINQRDHIKSKAFNTKLQMMNKEREVIDRKVNDERLRTKALHTKVQILEAENEKLMARLCEVEMTEKDDAELDSACKSLQLQMEQAEADMSRTRIELDAELHEMKKHAEHATIACDSLREECDRLRSQLREKEQQLQSSSHGSHHGQTSLELHKVQQQLNDENRVALEGQLEEEKTARERAENEREELSDKVSHLGGENFELTRRVAELEENLRDAESALSHLQSSMKKEKEKTKEDEEQKRMMMEREEELITLRGRMNERDRELESSKEEIKRMHDSLDHAHLSMAETSAVKMEVERLKELLEHERKAGEEKWNQVAAQLRSYEELASSSGWNSRKTSLEESNPSWVEERVRRAEDQADHLRRALDESEHARAALLVEVQLLKDERLDEEEAEMTENSRKTSGRTVERVVRLQRADPLESVQEEEKKNEYLEKRIEELEEEACLSEELNVELARSMEELQKRMEQMQIERRLHEMMNLDLTAELEELRGTENEQPVPASPPVIQSSPPVQLVHSDVREEQRKQERENIVLQEQIRILRETEHRMREEVGVLKEKMAEKDRREEEVVNATTDRVMRLEAELNGAEERRRQTEELLHEEQRRRLRLESERQRESAESLTRATAATFEAVHMVGQTAMEGETRNERQSSSDDVIPLQQDTEEERVESGEMNRERSPSELVEENVILRECVYQNVRHQENVSSDVARLLELKDELEKAVEALRGEIWSLNGQLKASILDRENLQDRVVDLDTKLSLEKRRGDLLDSDLAEQIELTEKAQRQAAEAENESNRRVAECAEMDSRREDLERAYSLLAGYYSQLQEAYNILYQRTNAEKNENGTQTEGENGEVEERTDVDGVPSEQESRQLASLYSFRLAITRQQLASIRELSVSLTKSVLATELATLEDELQNSITSIQGFAPHSSNQTNSSLEQQNVDALLEDILQHYEGEGVSSEDAHEKIASVHSMLKAKIAEVERVHAALREQRSVCASLEKRLNVLEGGGEERREGEGLPGELEERQEECEALRREIVQLQTIISEYATREDAAKLATREADVDSLFKTNAELAHTNVRLQNELDEVREEIEKHQSESSGHTKVTVAEWEELKDELQLTNEELVEKKEELIEAKRRYEEREQQLQDEKEQLEMTIVDLSEQMRREMERAEIEPEEDNSSLVAELNLKLVEERERRERAERRMREGKEASCRVEELERINDQLGQEVEQAQEEADALRLIVQQMEKELNKKRDEVAQMTEALGQTTISEEKREEEEEKKEEVKEEEQEEEEEGEGDWGDDWGSPPEGNTPDDKEAHEKRAIQEEISTLQNQISSLWESLEKKEEEEKRMKEEREEVDAKEYIRQGEEEKEKLREEVSHLTQRLIALEENKGKEREEGEEDEEKKEMRRHIETLEELVKLGAVGVKMNEKAAEEVVEEGKVKGSGWENDDWGVNEDEGEEVEEEKMEIKMKMNELEDSLEVTANNAQADKQMFQTMVNDLKDQIVYYEKELLARKKKEEEVTEEELNADEETRLRREVAKLQTQLLDLDKQSHMEQTLLRNKMDKLQMKLVLKENEEKEKTGWSDEEWEESRKESLPTEVSELQDRVKKLEERVQEADDDNFNMKGEYEFTITTLQQQLSDAKLIEARLLTTIAELGSKESTTVEGVLGSNVEKVDEEMVKQWMNERLKGLLKEAGKTESWLQNRIQILESAPKIVEIEENKVDKEELEMLRQEMEEMEEKLQGEKVSLATKAAVMNQKNRKLENQMKIVYAKYPQMADLLDLDDDVLEDVAQKSQIKKEEEEEEENSADIMATMQKSINEEQEYVVELQTRLEEERDKYENDMKKYEEIKMTLEERERMYDEMMHEFGREKGQMKDELDILRVAVQESRDEKNAMENTIEIISKELNDAHLGKEEENKQKSVDAEEKMKELQDELQEAKETAAEAEGLYVQLQKKTDENATLKKQNELLKDSESRLSECLDTSNGRMEKMEEELKRLKENAANTVASSTSHTEEKLQQLQSQLDELSREVERHKADVQAKESQLEVMRREAQTAQEKTAYLEKLLMEANENLRAARSSVQSTQRRGTTTRPVSRGSNASSITNDEVPEEPSRVTRPPSILTLSDNSTLPERSLCVRVLLDRVVEFLNESEEKEKETEKSLVALTITLTETQRRLEEEMGRKKGQGTKRTNVRVSEERLSGGTDLSPSHSPPPTCSLIEEEVAVVDEETLKSQTIVSSRVTDDVITVLDASSRKEGMESVMEEMKEETQELHVSPLQEELSIARSELSSLRDSVMELLTRTERVGEELNEERRKEKEEKEDMERQYMDEKCILECRVQERERELAEETMNRELLTGELEEANEVIWQLQQIKKEKEKKDEEKIMEILKHSEEVKKQLEEEKKENEMLMGEMEKVNVDKEGLEEILKKKERTIEEMKMITVEDENVMKEMKGRLAELRDEMEERIEKEAALIGEIGMLNAELYRMENEKENEEKLKERVEELSEMEKKMKRMEEEEEKVRNEVQMIRETMEKETAKVVSNLESIITQISSDIEKTKKELDESESARQAEREETQRILKDCNEKEKNLQEELEKEESERRKGVTVLEKEREENEKKMKELEGMCKDEMNEKQRRVETLETLLVEVESQLMEMREQDAQRIVHETHVKKEFSLREEAAEKQRRVQESLRDMQIESVRMEGELVDAHERLNEQRRECNELESRLKTSEELTMAARQEVARMAAELDTARGQLQQLARSSTEEEAKRRILQLEREAVENRAEWEEKMDRVVDELRMAEERLTMAARNETEAAEGMERLEMKVSEWRSRYEDAMGELEGIRRGMDEVRHLESALQQSHGEQKEISNQLAVAINENRQLGEEKDAAINQMHALTEQLALRTERLLRAGEERNVSVQRMVENEQQMNALQQRIEELQKKKKEERERKVETAVVLEVQQVHEGQRRQSEVTAIQVESEEDSQTVNDTWNDEILPQTHVVSASSPLPSLIERMQQWMRLQRRTLRRGIMRERAVMPYVRYAAAVYIVFLQLAVIHCWFF